MEDASWLERPFGNDEIKEVVFGMNDEKAQGMDVFSFLVYKACWEVVRACSYLFFECGRFLRRFNATFIVLIHKKSGATNIKDFRPISLIKGCTRLFRKF